MTTHRISRRGFLGLAAAATSVPLLAACNVSGSSNSGGGSSSSLKFWDMPWGAPAYNDAAKKVVEAYKPTGDLQAASYQIVQWNGFYQTFSSAIASKTGPAVSSGAGFQAFQFADQGAIAYADDLIEAMKKDGTYDDFLPGMWDTVKTSKGSVGIPWQQDLRVLWYNKALLEQAGVDVPTDWDSLLSAGKALRKIGVSGFNTGAGAGNPLGSHTMVSWMINNGGGMFNADGQPDCVTDRNIEAMDFIRELVSEGVIDKGAVSYTSTNQRELWNTGKAGIGVDGAGLNLYSPKTASDLAVMSPIKAPHGDTGCALFVNNLMMYTNTPSQQASEAFLTYYLSQLKTFWDTPLASGLPVTKSAVKAKTVAGDPNSVKIIKEWQPVGRTYAALGTQSFAGLAAVDGGQALTQFAQTMLQGTTDSKTALTALQKGIEAEVNK